ncbi:MAG TPA: response regulator [Steroidobacteraceae bacterium]|nr:response regulator [Steroidobacteraceae bacterium]
MTQAMHQILVIEDDAGIRGVLRMLLQSDGYRVIEAETAKRGEIEARTHKPDLLLVDLGLPDDEGTNVVTRIRKWSSIPIVILSARTQEEQKVAALDAGADDYVTKPFSAPELLARVRAALRRTTRAGEVSSILRFGAVEVDLARRQATGPDGPVHFTPLEYRVLQCLSQQGGMIVTQAHLIREVWGPDRVGDTASVRACLKHLREKLEPSPPRWRYLITETGVGYRLQTSEGR